MKVTLSRRPYVYFVLNRKTAHVFCHADSLLDSFPFLKRPRATLEDNDRLYRLLDTKLALSKSTSRRAEIWSGTMFVSGYYLDPDEARRLGRVFIQFWCDLCGVKPEGA
jgi:hypothetical protein